MRLLATLALATLVGLACGVGAHWIFRAKPAVESLQGPVLGTLRPDFALAGLDGNLWRASDFDGIPLVVNFWATWCKPCVREMPMLKAFSERHTGQVAVIGIAIDEPDRVRDFANRLGIDYPILIGNDDVHQTQKQFGNPAGMLPYTVLVDAAGTIRWQHLGELDREMIEAALQQAL